MCLLADMSNLAIYICTRIGARADFIAGSVIERDWALLGPGKCFLGHF